MDIAHSQVDRVFEYSCPPETQVGCRVKVPFGGRVIEGFVIGVSPNSAFAAEKIKPVTKIYDEQPALVPECFALMERIAERYRVPKAASLRLFLPSEMRLGKVNETYTRRVKYTGGDPALSKSAKKQAEALSFLKEVGDTDFTSFSQKFGNGAVNALVDKGAAEIYKVRRNRAPDYPESANGGEKVLTPAQQGAVDYIENSPARVNLIHGVTGSGKTEIYLKIIADKLKEGKSAIFPKFL